MAKSIDAEGYGGDVLKFSGDAVTILWKVDAGRRAWSSNGCPYGGQGHPYSWGIVFPLCVYSLWDGCPEAIYDVFTLALICYLDSVDANTIVYIYIYMYIDYVYV